MTKPKTTEMTVAEPGGYLAVLDSPDTMMAIRENLASGFDPNDIPRITVPAGGGLAWTVETLDGPEPKKFLDGIIIHRTNPRAFWRDSMATGGGGNPPDCASVDGVKGVGNPGGDCATCPMNAFGTADGGSKKGKACREKSNLLLLAEGAALPVVVSAPITSIKNVNAYFMRLASGSKPFWSVVTRLSLAQDKSADGIVYSKIEPTFVRAITAEEREGLLRYRTEVLPHLMAAVAAAPERQDS